MKKTVKRIVGLVLVLALVFSLAGCAKIKYVTNAQIKAINEVKSGDWKNAGTDAGEDAEANVDSVVLESEFKPDTYGGVEFKTQDDAVNYYIEAYNYTKSLTAQYDDNGETKTYYKLLGDEKLNVGDVYIDGATNSIVNGLVPTIVDNLFKPNTYGLVPCNNRDPEYDNNFGDESKKADHDFRTSELTPEDILAVNVKDNGDGTITMEIQPKAAEMSTRGDDSQGRFFEVLGDIGGVVGQIKQVSFTEGDASDNVKVTYKGGVGTVTINTATKEITEANYEMKVDVNVTHASIAVIKDKSASLSIVYTNHYPAGADYLKEKRNITAK